MTARRDHRSDRTDRCSACTYVAFRTYAAQGTVPGDIAEGEQAMDDLLHTAHDPQSYDDVRFRDGTVSTLNEADHGCPLAYMNRNFAKRVGLCDYPTVVVSGSPELGRIVSWFESRSGVFPADPASPHTRNRSNAVAARCSSADMIWCLSAPISDPPKR